MPYFIPGILKIAIMSALLLDQYEYIPKYTLYEIENVLWPHANMLHVNTDYLNTKKFTKTS